MPPVTDPVTCDTRQVLLEWDFSSTNKTTQVEMTKVPYRLGPPTTSSPESWHGQAEGDACDCTSWNGNPFDEPPNASGYLDLPAGREQRKYSHWPQS